LGVLLSVGDPTAPSDDGPASVSGIHRLPPIDGRLPPIDGLEADGPGTRTILGPPPAGTGVPWATSRWPWLSRAGHLLLEDQRGFYACESVTGIAAAFGAGAIMANTGFDTTVQNAWQRSVTPSDLGHFFSGCKDIGEGRYALAVFGTAAATGVALDGLPVADVVGDWGERSLRIFVVGAAPLYVLQLATGASRPEESSAGSRWKFFQDANGVSGHAFVGAIPFLAAAGMVESPLAKGSLYVCSTFVGFSRVTDNDHYPSQIFLGWYLAFASAMAVNRTDLHFAGMEVEVVPIVLGDAQGLGLVATW
jgi:membrane-associated phospholipid phosphatase